MEMLKTALVILTIVKAPGCRITSFRNYFCYKLSAILCSRMKWKNHFCNDPKQKIGAWMVFSFFVDTQCMIDSVLVETYKVFMCNTQFQLAVHKPK